MPHEIRISDDMGRPTVLRVVFADDGDVLLEIRGSDRVPGASIEVCSFGTRYPGLAGRLRQAFAPVPPVPGTALPEARPG